MIRISALTGVLKHPRTVVVGCTRNVSGGYNENPADQDSVVSGPNPKEQYSPAHAWGRSYRKSIPGIGEVIDYEKDTFANFKVEAGVAQPAQSEGIRDYERLHTESFAFQEWGEVRHQVVRDYKTRSGLMAHKWDVAEEEMEFTWRSNPGGRDPAFRQPYSPPEELNPRPMPHSDPYVLRIPHPIYRRNETKPLQRGTTWRMDPRPILQQYATWADYEGEGSNNVGSSTEACSGDTDGLKNQ